MNLKPYTKTETDRLFLRPITVSDAEEILFLRSDKTITKFIERPEKEKTKTKKDAIQFINMINDGFKQNKFITWGITLNENSKIIGTICLWNFSKDYKTAEVGYDLHYNHQGKGIMNEALNRILNLSFNELKLSKILAYTHKDNSNSRKLLERNHFSINKNKIDINNKFNVIYEIANKLIL